MECMQALRHCRDADAALRLKVGAVLAIFGASACGVGAPLLMGNMLRRVRFCVHAKLQSSARTNDGASGANQLDKHDNDDDGGDLVWVVKAFSAGVMLATAFVHILPSSFAALTNACLHDYPWAKFPFAGFASMMAALLTFATEALALSFLSPRRVAAAASEHFQPGAAGHAAPSHTRAEPMVVVVAPLRYRVIAQVLELGIIAHSMIIGISVGTSQSPCTIRPLIIALCFHQFFEGIALGGAIAQAKYQKHAATMMAMFFSITSPIGIAIGIGFSSHYNQQSSTALVVEGLFDAISSGILVYMSLVDLIATDWRSDKIQKNVRLQALCLLAIFCGIGAMSLLAIWA